MDRRLIQKASYQHIPLSLVNRLKRLRNYSIVVIINDNDSMMKSDSGSSIQPQNQELTRFESLKFRLASVVPLLACLADRGLTVKALNQPEMVIDNNLLPEQKERHLSCFLETLKPGGNISLLNTLNEQFCQAKARNTPTIAYLLTDGDTDDCGLLNSRIDTFNLFNQFRTQARGDFFPISIMACTDDQNQLAWMNIIGNSIDHLRISNNYFHEATEAVETHGPINYSPGIHNTAFLLGAIEPIFDKLGGNSPLAMEELAMLSGRTISEREYDRYISGRGRLFRRSFSLPAPLPLDNPQVRRRSTRAAIPSCTVS